MSLHCWKITSVAEYIQLGQVDVPKYVELDQVFWCLNSQFSIEDYVSKSTNITKRYILLPICSPSLSNQRCKSPSQGHIWWAQRHQAKGSILFTELSGFDILNSMTVDCSMTNYNTVTAVSALNTGSHCESAQLWCNNIPALRLSFKLMSVSARGHGGINVASVLYLSVSYMLNPVRHARLTLKSWGRLCVSRWAQRHQSKGSILFTKLRDFDILNSMTVACSMTNYNTVTAVLALNTGSHCE